MIRQLFLGVGLALGLTACGFTPLYGDDPQGGVAAEIRSVQLTTLDGPPDAANEVRDALGRSISPTPGMDVRYTLDVNLRDQRRAIAVTRSAATTRFDYYLQGSYVLRDAATNAVLRRQQLDAVVSYGVVPSQYASLVGREDAVRRAALELSRRIELDIALFLKGQGTDSNEISLPPIIEQSIEEAGDPSPERMLEDTE